MHTWSELQEQFRGRFQIDAELAVRAPGRVNLIGEHIDYNGGLVLPMAIEREVRVLIARSDEPIFRFVSLQQPQEYCGPLPVNRAGLSWEAYPVGVLHEFRMRGFAVPGMTALVDGDIPTSSGLSSSAALEVAFAVALNAILSAGLSGMEIALLAQHAENEFVGVRCGLMDQAAVTLSRKGFALQLDCTKKSYAHAPLELSETRVLVAHSGLRRGLSHSQYNQRRAECEQALGLISRASGRQFDSLTSVPLDLVMDAELPALLMRRARHVVSEQARVEKAVQALASGDVRGLGEILDQSHFSLRDDYEVSCPELDELSAWLREQPGVYGARLTGAGFGGCTVSLVSDAIAPELLARLQRDFYESRNMESLCFYSGAAEGASIVTRR